VLVVELGVLVYVAAAQGVSTLSLGAIINGFMLVGLVRGSSAGRKAASLIEVGYTPEGAWPESIKPVSIGL